MHDRSVFPIQTLDTILLSSGSSVEVDTHLNEDVANAIARHTVECFTADCGGTPVTVAEFIRFLMQDQELVDRFTAYTAAQRITGGGN